ncbi:MAG: hypothetical protein M1813_006872 [Trichoglossum hirsutum]|nr:MAG: hypothetical protein M1813_006872 [Trichoglossum hirsutum]
MPPPNLPTSPPASLPSIASPLPPADPLARGLEALLAPAVQGTTERLYAVQQSQLAVGAELERLVFQLQHYLSASDPPQVKDAVDRMAALAKRLDTVNESFARIQTRLEGVLGALMEDRRRKEKQSQSQARGGEEGGEDG